MRHLGRLGLRARATVAWAAIALVLSTSLATVAYQLTRAELVDDRESRATSQAYLNARLLRSGLRAPEPDIGALLSSIEGNVRSGSLVRVAGQWYSGSVGWGPDVLPGSLADAVADGRAGRQLADVDGVPYVVVGVPIAESGARYFELVSLDDVDGSLANLARGLTVGAVLATGAAALAGWYASGRVLRPLRRLTGAASEIAEGSFGTRLQPFHDPDLDSLQRSFNHMADAVEDRIEREHRFTSDVSHELRSPLASMVSSIEIARRAPHDPVAVDDALAELERRTQRFHELVVDLLEISRVDAGVAELQAEPVDPVALVRAVSSMTTEEPIPVEVLDGAPEVISADKRRLGRMVMNLVENADRYAGGATRIEVAGVDGCVTIAVEDDGPGVPEHERRHVFGRFARGEDARRGTTSGTGLGLALVQEHAALHGGRARVESAPSGGARFVIELPVGEVDP